MFHTFTTVVPQPKIKKLRELRTLEVVFLISREEQEQRANKVGNNQK
jgi:hypothetical protein